MAHLIEEGGVGALGEETLLVQDGKHTAFGRLNQLHALNVVEVLHALPLRGVNG